MSYGRYYGTETIPEEFENGHETKRGSLESPHRAFNIHASSSSNFLLRQRSNSYQSNMNHKSNTVADFTNCRRFSSEMPSNAGFGDDVESILQKKCANQFDYRRGDRSGSPISCSSMEYVNSSFDDEDEERCRRVHHDAVTRAGKGGKWIFNFKMPAVADYKAFVQKVKSRNVCLETIAYHQFFRKFKGRVKVLNICFEKDVFLRCTIDNWRSQFDVKCFYHDKSKKFSSATLNIDTFTFEFIIPQSVRNHTNLQFCVGFKNNRNQYYWDNNNGNNYSAEYCLKETMFKKCVSAVSQFFE